MTTQIVALEEMNLSPAVVFGGSGLDPLLEKITLEARSLVPDLSTAKGRKEIASMANKVARSKTYLDGFGKDFVADQKASIKLVDNERKRLRDYLDALKTEVRQPLTEYEEAEKQRVEAHQQALFMVRSYKTHEFETAAAVSAAISSLEMIGTTESWEEFQSQAIVAKDASLQSMRELLTKLEADEAAKAELEMLRKQAAERDQKDREERIAREAKEAAEKAAADAIAASERKAQAVIDQAAQAKKDAEAAAEQAEINRINQAAQAERDVEEATKRAEARAEQVAADNRKRIEDEALAIAKAKADREANQEHKGKVNRNAVNDFMKMCDLTEDQAKAAVVAIFKGQISNVTIAY